MNGKTRIPIKLQNLEIQSINFGISPQYNMQESLTTKNNNKYHKIKKFQRAHYTRTTIKRESQDEKDSVRK